MTEECVLKLRDPSEKYHRKAIEIMRANPEEFKSIADVIRKGVDVLHSKYCF